MDGEQQDYYQILQVSPLASVHLLPVTCTAPPLTNSWRGEKAREIGQTYRRACLYCHPDCDASEAARERFQRLQEAYSVLADTQLRAQYDRWRQANVQVPFRVWRETGSVAHWRDDKTARLEEKGDHPTTDADTPSRSDQNGAHNSPESLRRAFRHYKV